METKMRLSLSRLIKMINLTSFLLIFSVLTTFTGCKNEKPDYSEEGKKEINGTTLYYKIVGNGEPIVVLHGGPGFEHTYLLPGITILSEKYKLLFYDQRGSGYSSADIDSSSVTIENFIEDLESFRKSFNLEKLNIMGHSWGGLLGMLYAIKYPNNLNSLMLINTAPARSDFWDEFYKNIARNRTSEDSIEIAAIKASEAYKNNEPVILENYFRAFFRAYFYDQNLADSLNLRFTETTLKNRFIIYRLYDYLRNFDILDQLNKIECPTLIVHGDSDPIPLYYIEEINERIKHSELIVINQCGHFPYIEKSREFMRVIFEFMENIEK